MRKADVDQFAAHHPFEPFEIRLVDGQRFKYTKLEQLIVGKTAIGALTRKCDIVLINMSLIATIRPAGPNGKSRSGEPSGKS